MSYSATSSKSPPPELPRNVQPQTMGVAFFDLSRFDEWTSSEQDAQVAAFLQKFYALAAEQTHIDLYGKAKEAVDGGADMPPGPVQVCEVCGWTVEDEIPEKCPICAAKRDRFRTFE